MARNTVEYYSSKLGSGVIDNAASEATLQELLRAYKDSVDNNSDDDDDLTESTNAASVTFKLLRKGFASLGAGIGHTVGAGKNFISMIARGEDKLSAYGRFIQEDLIKKLPVVGDTLGDLSGIIVEGISILEGWNDGLKQVNKQGATFNYSIFKFKETALDMGLSTDELVSLVGNNTDKLVSLGGGTMTTGMENVRKLSAALFMDSDKVSSVLDRWGYNTYQQNEMLIDFYASTMRGKAVNEKNIDQTSKEFLAYAAQVDTYQKLTGMNRDQRQEAAAAAAQDITYRMKVSKLGIPQQRRMETALNSFAMVFGADAAEIFKSRELNVQSISDTALALQYALGPSFEKSMDAVIKMAKEENVDPKVFEDYVNKTIGSQLANSKEAMKTLEGIIKGSVSGNEQNKKIVKALTPAMEFIIKQGGMSKDMQNQFTKMIASAKAEQNKTDAFTDVLRTFQRSVMRVYRALLKGFFPVMKDLAREFKIAMIPEKMKEFNNHLIALAKEALPYVKNFFMNLTDDETLRYMGDMFSAMFEAITIHFRIFMREMIYDTFGVAGAAKYLSKLGIGPDLDRMRDRADALVNFSKEVRDQLILPKEERRYPVKPEDQKIVVGDQTFYVRDLARGSSGFFKSFSSEFQSGSGDDVRSQRLEEAIQILREQQASKGARPADDRDKFGGLTMLQRDALSWFVTRPIMGFRNSLEHFAPMLANPTAYAEASEYDKTRIRQFLNESSVQDRIKSNAQKYPNTYKDMFRSGTLGSLGKLFGNFKGGTIAELHGKEAVVSPAQLQGVINASAQISMRDVANRLNSNINRLIQVAKHDVNIERSKLLAMT